MGKNHLFEMEDALRSLNHALDALKHAEERSDVLHPSIGNHITSAKLIVSEAIESLLQEREKVSDCGRSFNIGNIDVFNSSKEFQYSTSIHAGRLANDILDGDIVSAKGVAWLPLYSKIANEIKLSTTDDIGAQSGYGNFPTLAEIHRDYNKLMELISDVKTPEQAKALADSNGLIVEINGEPVNDFLADPFHSQIDIDWIRYECFGCLTYIYDTFDGQPVFDVWSNAMYDEFITNVTYGDLTEKGYEVQVAAAIKSLIEKGVVSKEQVDALIEKQNGVKPSLNDRIQSAADKATNGAIQDDPVTKMAPIPDTTSPDWGQKHCGSER